MTFKEWLRQTSTNPTKANELNTLVSQAERQREINEDMSIDIHFSKKEVNKSK